MHDGLTGLANRRLFDLAIEREFRRAAWFGCPISIIMIDIDHWTNPLRGSRDFGHGFDFAG